MAYLTRLSDQRLEEALAYAGAVVIEGAKAVGKTALTLQRAQTAYLLDTDQSARALADTAPEVLLAACPPVLLDEWQLVPALWNQVKRAVDADNTPGRFILAGSAQPADDITRHSGAGRFARLHIRPLTGYERGIGTAEISLKALLRGEASAVRDPGLTVPALADLICHGGFPGHHQLGTDMAQRALRDYVGELVRTDINTVDGVRRDPLKVSALRLAEVQYYRDEGGLEVDAIVTAEDGRWCAIEIKLGNSAAVVDAAAAALLKFAARIDTDRMGKPAALVVITGSGHGFVRPDGVIQVPYAALAP
jgi:predicted AAA+ superfamily ATPase